jgi:enamine deaminase RidA (YjgF/YER057c/UK114 family)
VNAEDRLAQRLSVLGLELPAAAEPKGVYRPLVIVGNMAYTAGHLPIAPGGGLLKGRVGEDLDRDEGHRAALLAGLGILATLRAALGSLDRVRHVVKVLGMVNCTPDFIEHPAVINGCSELFAHVFGPDAGVAARSAVGVASLPLGAAVEIEAVFEIE